MGKGKRTRIDSDFNKELEAKKAEVIKKQKAKGILKGVIICLCILAIGVSAVFGSLWYNSAEKNGKLVRNKIALQTENFSVNTCMMQYFYNSAIRNFKENYDEETLEEMELDTTSDLKEQASYFEPSQTWHEYFTESAKEQVEEVLIMCEGAFAKGIELSTGDKRQIEDAMGTLLTSADEEGLTEEEYIDSIYGSWVSREDIEKAMELTALASKYYSEYLNSLNFSQKEINNEYNKNKELYIMCDYLFFEVSGKDKADEFVSIKNESDFRDKMEEYLEESLKKYPTADIDMDTALQEELEAAEQTGVGYYDTDEIGKWVFHEDRKAGDTVAIKNEDEKDSYYVIYMLAPAEKDSTISKNIRHILVDLDKYDSDEECSLAAEKILKDWRNGEKTEESFALLAEKKSHDLSSAVEGGLYRNISEGDIGYEFDDWAFNKNRKSGDVGIVSADYGYHVMYFVGEGLPKWQIDVVDTLKLEKYEEYFKELEKDYEIKFNQENIDIINQIYTSKEETEDEEEFVLE